MPKNKEDVQVAIKQRKKMIVIREMQILIKRLHCIPSKTCTAKATNDAYCWQGNEHTGKLRHFEKQRGNFFKTSDINLSQPPAAF